MPYPTALDNLSESYLGTDQVSVVDHAGMHNDANAAINDLQAKLGIDSSAVTTSIDYLLKSTSSVSPGHKHNATDIADGSVTNAEFQYLGGVTSDIQTQLNSKQDLLTNGSGTTINGTAVDLGGILTADANIDATSDKVFRIRTSTYVNNGLLGVDANTSTAWIGDISGDSRSIFFLADEGNRYLLLNAPANTIRFNDLSLAGASNGYVWTLADQSTGEGAWSAISGFVTSVTGTANRITSTGGTTPQIDISASYVGQASITTLGTVATGTWNATTIAVNRGGTGQTSYTNGQLLIGNTTGNTLTKATLTGTTNQVVVTNGSGSITLSLPQSIATSSSVTFGNVTNSALTAGRVTFAGTSGILTDDSAFLWNSTSNILTVGSTGKLSSPEASTVFLGGTPNASYSGNTNAFFGYNTGIGNTVQYGNTYIGSESGASTSSDAYFNTFIGTYSGKLTQGRSNTFIGWNTGSANTTGYANTMIGAGVYASGTGSTNCTAVGIGAGASIGSVNGFTAFGYQAGSADVSGSENTYLGTLAGYSNVSGSFSTYVGSRAGGLHTGGGSVFLGYSAGGSVTGDFNTIIGRSAANNLTTGTDNVVIGYNLAVDSATGSNQTNINNTFMATSTVARISGRDFKIEDAKNIIFDTTTGTKIGTATGQKIGFWNTTPIVQPTTAVAAATFVTNTSLIANDTATFDGYTIGQIVKALRNAGLLA